MVQGQLAKPEEVDQLVTRAYSSLEAAESDVPFQRRSCDLSLRGWTIRQIRAGACWRSIAGFDSGSRVFEMVLRFVSARVDHWADRARADALSPDLLGLAGTRQPTNHPRALSVLKLSGLVKGDGQGLLVVRNKIYHLIFTAQWAAKSL